MSCGTFGKCGYVLRILFRVDRAVLVYVAFRTTFPPISLEINWPFRTLGILYSRSGPSTPRFRGGLDTGDRRQAIVRGI